MQHDFPDLAENVPEQDLLLSFGPEVFDDYWGELEDMAVGNSEGLATGAQLFSPGTLPETDGVRLDSTWSAEELQGLSSGAGPSRPSGPVITTGALPVARDQPSTFLTDLPQPESNAWSANLPAPSQSQQQQSFPLSSMQQYSSMSDQPQYQHDNGFSKTQLGQADSQVADPDALLKQVEEILKGDKSPSVQARLRALVAAQGQANGPAVSPHTLQQQGNQFNLESQANALNTYAYSAAAPYPSSLTAPYQSSMDSMHQRPAHRQSLQPPVGQLPSSHTANQPRHTGGHLSGLQSIADSTQPQMVSRGADSFAWPSGDSATLHTDTLRRRAQKQQGLLPTTTDPRLSQAFQSHLPQQLPQQLPGDRYQLPDSLSFQDQLQNSVSRPNAMQARRTEELTRQTGARSLQQQAQARLPRQDATIKQAANPRAGTYPPPGSDFPQPVPGGGVTRPSGLSQGLFDAWGLPSDGVSQRADLQRHSQGSNTAPDTSFLQLTTPFASVAGTQSMTQALMDPMPFSPLPLDDPAAFELPSTQYGSSSQQAAPPATLTAPLPAAAGRLPAYTAAPFTAPPGRPQVNGSLPIGIEPLPIRPAAPQRAPPPEDRAAAARTLALAAQGMPAAQPALQSPHIHPSFQGNSQQESSGGSCGLAASAGYTAPFCPVTSQVDASRPDVFGNPGQLDLPLSGLQPAAMPQLNQAPSAEQADDWAQFINMDADGEEKGQQAGPDDREEAHTQQDGAEGANGNAENNGGRPKRKRKRDSHQQELNKQAQHRYRERKKAKAAELAQQVQLLSSKAASLQTAKLKQTRLKEHNEALRKALEVKKAELSQAMAAARQSSPPPEAAPAEDRLAEKVSMMEQKAKSLAQQLHGKVFELDRHLKQSGLANKAHVPWDGGLANAAGAAALEVIRRLVHEIHVITHEAHKVEGADIWDVVHREVPPRHCPVGCHCLHCKDKDAWLDVAQSLKLTDKQKCKAMLLRDHTLHTLHEVYEKRRALNLEAITLMVPQGRSDVHGKDGLQQHFADMAFFSRARTTGKMGEVVDKLKANLREEAHANAVLDYIMFTRILSPVQSAWFITEAYPLKFDCRALASAVFQLWGHMRLAPALLQQPQQQQQLPSKLLTAQQQQQVPVQLRAPSPARRMEPISAGPASHIRAASPARRMDPMPPAHPAQGATVRQQGLVRSHPASSNLPSVPLQRHSLGPQVLGSQASQRGQQLPPQQQERMMLDLPQMAAAQQQLRQQQQHQQQLQAQSMMQMPTGQHAQHAQHQQTVQGLSQLSVPHRAQHAQNAAQLSAAQRAQQLQSLQALSQAPVGQLASQQPSLTSSLQQQQQELERRKWQQMLQQRLGMPPTVALSTGAEPQGHLPARQIPSVADAGANLSGQHFMGLGALQASNSMMVGAVPRPPGRPMVVP